MNFLDASLISCLLCMASSLNVSAQKTVKNQLLLTAFS
ncbi:hypothetical protein HCH_02181 [Hahella chejuensis KCTC 2396]|uniref:Uncharacterized protein n=1 Tax=Hahella chejuensis (strain KCTC 2396) TaxID=349521 RepID=Q2SK15_HAHCH|nr:hypothetical protein HCH_02181 [Hahella chejuensis KCTC 2396]